jgi:hypothetical protein
MAAITSIKEVGYGMGPVLLESRALTNTATVVHSGLIQTPANAKIARFYLDVTAVGGTTPTVDFVVQEVHPVLLDDAKVQNLGSWDGITQLTAAGYVTVTIGESATADDTATQYSIQAPLPRQMYYKVSLDGTTADEDYTYTLYVDFK